MPNRLRALIVDDEYPARRELRALLKPYEQVQVVGEAADAEEALELLGAVAYDLVFLDIVLPGDGGGGEGAGIEVARRLLNHAPRPKVVFVTGYPQYGVDAFRVEASDYLLKPVDAEQFDRVMRRLLGQFRKELAPGRAGVDPDAAPAAGAAGDEARPAAAERRRLDRLRPPDRLRPRIAAERARETALVDIDQVVFLYSRQEEVFLRTREETLRVRGTLQDLEARLGGEQFLRVHRQYLVNLSYVKGIGPYHKGTFHLLMDDGRGTQVPVSRVRSKQVRRLLGL